MDLFNKLRFSLVRLLLGKNHYWFPDKNPFEKVYDKTKDTQPIEGAAACLLVRKLIENEKDYLSVQIEDLHINETNYGSWSITINKLPEEN